VDAGRTLGSWQKGTITYFDDNYDWVMWPWTIAHTGTTNNSVIWRSDIGLDPILWVSYNINWAWAGMAGNNSVVGDGWNYWITRPRNVALLYCIKISGTTSTPSSNVTWNNMSGTGIGNVTLATTGNVGIWTTSPTAKLDVAGGVRVTESIWIGSAGPETPAWWASIHKDSWAIVTRKADGWDNFQPQNAIGSIYANDIYLRSTWKWVSELGSGSAPLPCFYAPTQAIVAHGTTHTVYVNPQPNGDLWQACATRTTTCNNGQYTYPLYTTCNVYYPSSVWDQGGPP
jgi:hypothetical protein